MSAEGNGSSVGGGSAEVEHWKKQALELAAQNAELKSQVGAAEAGAMDARQVHRLK